MLAKNQIIFLRKMSQTMATHVQVGKDGIHEQVITTIQDDLKANELVKIKLLKSFTEPVKEVAMDIAVKTNSDIIHIIGHTFVLYRKNKENPVIELPIGNKK